MKGEPGLALRAAEEARTSYSKLGEKAGKAVASQLVAEAQFALVPFGQGNSREAVRAAQDAATLFEGLNDSPSWAVALHVLANAQLMSHSGTDAQKTAREAEKLFQGLGDTRGQAGALLLVSGGYLSAGEYAEARDAAKDARDLFRQVGDGAGEDSVEDFLDSLKQYESGQLNRADFVGFSMRGPEAADGQQVRRRPKDKQVDTSLATIELIVPGAKNEKFTMALFDGFESRQARAPGQRARSGSAAVAEAFAQEVAKAAPAKDQAVYTVRWVPSRGGPGEPKPNPKEPQKVEDRRINVTFNLGQPTAGWGGRTGPSNRMFTA